MIVQNLELTRKRWVGSQNFVPDNNIMCGDSMLIRNYNHHALKKEIKLGLQSNRIPWYVSVTLIQTQNTDLDG